MVGNNLVFNFSILSPENFRNFHDFVSFVIKCIASSKLIENLSAKGPTCFVNFMIWVEALAGNYSGSISGSESFSIFLETCGSDISSNVTYMNN